MIQALKNIPPLPDEIEISVFGHRYGESILIHVLDNNWILVDSCFDVKNRQSAIKTYLQCMNLDLNNSLKGIVITHWHDDHIKGISEVVAECGSAKIFVPNAMSKSEFLSVIKANNDTRGIAGTGVREFNLLLNHLISNKQINRMLFVSPNSIVYDQISKEETSIQIKTLSPSTADFIRSLEVFQSLFSNFKGAKKYILDTNKNYFSIALWIKIGDEQVLLGSDVENTTSADSGWSAIILGNYNKDAKASFFKIPHHGAQTGHSDDVWKDLLIDKPISVATSFINGNVSLPKVTDINRIKGLASVFYLLKPQQHNYNRDHRVNKLLKASNSINVISAGNYSQVCFRKKINTPEWTITKYGNIECYLQDEV